MINFQVLFDFSVCFLNKTETEKRAVGSQGTLEWEELRKAIPEPGKHRLLSDLSSRAWRKYPGAVLSTYGGGLPSARRCTPVAPALQTEAGGCKLKGPCSAQLYLLWKTSKESTLLFWISSTVAYFQLDRRSGCVLSGRAVVPQF